MTTFALAVDLGGTKVEAALVDAEATVFAASRSRRPTGPGTDPTSLRAAIAEVVTAAASALPDGAELLGAGIGSAGPIDAEAGVIHPVNMPAVHGFALGAAVGDALAAAGFPGLPVRVGHDGGCLALAESWVGAAAGARSSLSIVVSTGVGGGIVMEGAPMRGASGNAGHLGQTHVAEGVLELVASGPSSVAWARSQGWNGAQGEDLSRDAAAGDVIARAAIERSAAAVGHALADASTLLDLEIVVIGGGFSRVAPDYIDLVAAALESHAVLPYAARTRVVRSGLGDEGPLVGAAALLLR